MSHVAKIDIEIKDLEALKAACKRLGFTFNEGVKKFRWFGRFVDDTRIPDGMFDEEETARLRKMSSEERRRIMTERFPQCEHEISVPGCSYSVGVVKKGNGYQLRYDYYESAIVSALGGQSAPLIVQAYAIEKARREALKLGYRVLGEQKNAQGAVTLRVQAR
jgi:hypothetical protein